VQDFTRNSLRGKKIYTHLEKYSHSRFKPSTLRQVYAGGDCVCNLTKEAKKVQFEFGFRNRK